MQQKKDSFVFFFFLWCQADLPEGFVYQHVPGLEILQMCKDADDDRRMQVNVDFIPLSLCVMIQLYSTVHRAL